MSIFNPPVHGDGDDGVDTGDIGHSLRCRSAASTYLSRTPGSAGDRKTWTISLWGKLGNISTDLQRILSAGTDTNNVTEIIISANKIRFQSVVSSVSRGVVESTELFRDTTATGNLVVAFDAANTTVDFYWNNLTLSKTVSTAVSNIDHMVNAAVAHNIGRYFGAGNYFDGYLSRIAFVDGQALTPSSFGYLNTEINEWVSKSQSAVKAVVDAGGTNSFMLDFDDATSLTTLGYDKSSKGNNWTLNNFSLTAGTTYDHMLDVPGNSYATLNPLDQKAGVLSNANLTYVTTNASTTDCVHGSMAFPPTGKWYCEVTITAVSGTSGHDVGITRELTYTKGITYAGFNGNKHVEGAASAYGAAYTTNDVVGVAFDADSLSVEFFKNSVSQGVISGVVAGTYFLHLGDGTSSGFSTFVPLFGQAPLHASATYHSAAGGYFRYTPPTGYKALCQANLPTPAILNPKNGFVAVTDTEANIDATLATARTGWTDFVDIKKNRAAVESWVWQFSHDSTNEYAVGAASSVHQAKRAMSGANTWVGYSIRIGATYGSAAGSVSHTNGVATTVTHNIGVSARQLILIFRRASTTAVPVYHPDLTSGELLDLCSTAADAASTLITSVATNSFQIGSGNTTGTYDYLVCSELSGFFDLGKWTGNAAADGAYYDAGHKPAMLYVKALSTTDDHRVYDNLRPGYNVQGGTLLANTTAAETTAAEIDLTALGAKLRITTTPNAAQTYVTANWASASGKYSLAR